MKLIKKLNILTVVFTLVSILIVSCIVSKISIDNYFELENIIFEKDLLIIKNLIKEDFESLEYIVND